MSAQTYTLTLGAILSIIAAFYTATLPLIFSLAQSGNTNAMVFSVGFLAVLGVAIWNFFTSGGRRINR